MRKYFRKNESGAALLFAIILITIMLGVGLTLSTIFIGKLRASVDAKSSIGAYYAADSGIEWKLYEKRVGPEAFGNQLGIGSEFEIDDPPEYMRSLGTYRGVSRAIEVVDLEVEPTPTPPPTCPPGGLTFLAQRQDPMRNTEADFLFQASVDGTLDTGHDLIFAGSGFYETLRTYTRQDSDYSVSIGFIPDDSGGIECARISITIPVKDVPPPLCSDIEPITLSETHTETDTTITFTFTSNRSGIFLNGNPRTFTKQATARLETVTFVADYQSLGCTKNITLSIPVEILPAPNYEWVRINSNTYPGLTAKNNGCGATMRQTKTCAKNGVGMVTRMYNVTVGDGTGQGWSETPQAAIVGQGIGSNITYTRFVNCTHKGGASAGPGTRVYECKNTGGPEPAPAPPPAYQWVLVRTQPAFQPHVPSISLRTCSGGSNTSMTVICNASIVNKIAVAEIKSTAAVVVVDRGSYYQGRGGNISADKTTITITGPTCASAPQYRFLGAGNQSWYIWQCQESSAIAMNDQNDSILARLWGAIINLFR